MYKKKAKLLFKHNSFEIIEEGPCGDPERLDFPVDPPRGGAAWRWQTGQ